MMNLSHLYFVHKILQDRVEWIVMMEDLEYHFIHAHSILLKIVDEEAANA